MGRAAGEGKETPRRRACGPAPTRAHGRLTRTTRGLLCGPSYIWTQLSCSVSFPGGSVVKSPPANPGDMGSIPGFGRSPGEEKGNPPQYSCLGKPVDRGAWRSTVMGSQRVGQDFATKQQHHRHVLHGQLTAPLSIALTGTRVPGRHLHSPSGFTL